MKIIDNKRIVIKIGSTSIIDEETGAIKHAWLSSLASDIAQLVELGKEVVIISSGAIAIGKKFLQLSSKNSNS